MSVADTVIARGSLQQDNLRINGVRGQRIRCLFTSLAMPAPHKSNLNPCQVHHAICSTRFIRELRISADRSLDMPPDADIAIPGWALEASICIFIPSSHKNSNASLDNLCHGQIQGILRVACVTDAVIVKRCECQLRQYYLACSSSLACAACCLFTASVYEHQKQCQHLHVCSLHLMHPGVLLHASTLTS